MMVAIACPFHAITGLDCPGCGATHAIAALATGHLTEALRINALVTIAIPMLAVRIAWVTTKGKGIVIPAQSAPLLAAIAVLFGLLRNL
jgi:hypothetical protein